MAPMPDVTRPGDRVKPGARASGIGMDRRAFHVLLGAMTAVFVAVFAALQPGRLVSFVADGAGYYLQIAHNVAGGRGITFDGLHPTNGFHPLWLAVLVPVLEIVRGTPELVYRTVGILDVGLLAVASWTFHRTLRQLVSPAAALAGGAVFAASAFFNVNLMETALVLLTTSALFAYAWRCHEREDSRVAPSLGFGLILGACILARLDAGFIALAMGIVDLARILRSPDGRRQRFVRLASIMAGASVLVVPYLLYNRVAFGAILPVSGRIESLFPHPNARGLVETARALGPIRTMFWLVAVAYLPAYALWRRRSAGRATPRERFLHGSVALVAAACLAHSAHEILFIRWQLSWHYWMLVPLGGAIASIVFQQLIDRSPGPASRAFAFAGLAVVLLVLAWGTQRRMRAYVNDPWRVRLYDASLWIRDHVEPDATLAMRDAEIPGFFADLARRA
jgi:hypothetical protein